MTRRVGIIAGIVIAAALAGAAAMRALARSRTFQFFRAPIAHVATTDSVVALTFDDGPAPARVDTLLTLLASRNVHASFFLIGRAVAEAPGAVNALVGAGHEIGNHTYSHQHMVFRSLTRYREEVSHTDSLLRAAGAREPIYFRPPYGYKLVGLPFVLWRTDRTTITWDIEPESFPEVARSADRIVEHVLSRVRPGSIILLHPWYASGAPTRTAIPALIDSLRSRGYDVVPVGSLLSRSRAAPQ